MGIRRKYLQIGSAILKQGLEYVQRARYVSTLPKLPECSFIPPEYRGPSKDEVKALRAQYMNPGESFCTKGQFVVWSQQDLAVCIEMCLNPLPACKLSPIEYRNDILIYFLLLLNETKCYDSHNAAIFHHFKDPVMIVDGHMQYLFDEQGKRYLDVCVFGFITDSMNIPIM